MAKVTDVNINLISNELGYGISGMMTLLLANGWTLVSCGTGTAGVRRTTPALSLAEWLAAANTWQIVSRPLLGAGAGTTVYVVMKRNSSTTMDVRFAHTSGALTAGSATAPDTFPAGTEVTYNSLNMTGSTRAHAITFDTNENAAGIRPFYLVFTTGVGVQGGAALEAMADGSYITANPAPYAVAAAGSGNSPFNGIACWTWWYSPSSLWVPQVVGNFSFNTYFGPATGCGVDPWSAPASAKDPNFPISFGRLTSTTSPGFVGSSKYLKGAGVLRGYPNTVDTTTDAYVYVASCLIPYANNVVPL
jgi:hypothetical protein